MHATKPLLLALLLSSLAFIPAVAQQAAQSSGAKATLDRGVELFGQEKYRESLELFGKVMSDSKASAERPEAAYWAVLAYLAVGDQATAGSSIDAFISAYPKSPRVPDLLYQRGRILYAKADYEGALKVFAAFSSAAPSSDLLPSALYWSGESLYALGRLEEAERAFNAVVNKYPSSVKVEASAYRISLIGLEYRQRELLKLLTWSHEESLRSVEDFRQRREKAYEASIALYQKQISDSKRGTATDPDKVIADLRIQVADLGSRLASCEAKLATAQAESGALRASLAGQSGERAEALSPPRPMDKDSRTAALEAKSRALDLLAYYLESINTAALKDGSK